MITKLSHIILGYITLELLVKTRMLRAKVKLSVQEEGICRHSQQLIIQDLCILVSLICPSNISAVIKVDLWALDIINYQYFIDRFVPPLGCNCNLVYQVEVC